MAATRFESARWIGEIGHAEGSFLALNSLVANEKVVTAHLESQSTSKALPRIFQVFKKQGISDAHAIHRRQMIVLAASIFEGCVGNFLRALFETRPELMHNYLGSEASKGTLSLKLVVTSPTRDQLVRSLSDQAASRVLGLKYSKILSALDQLGGQPLPKPLLSQLGNLLEQRNRIVHEGSAEPVSPKDVKDRLQTVRQLTSHLELVAQSAGVPTLTVADQLKSLGFPE